MRDSVNTLMDHGFFDDDYTDAVNEGVKFNPPSLSNELVESIIEGLENRGREVED